jgi:hypothetical protein
MQWQTSKCPKFSRSLLLSCWFAFNCDYDGISCIKIKAKWNLSLSQSSDYHHPDSLMGKKETNCHINFVVEELTTLSSKWVFESVCPLFLWRWIWWKDIRKNVAILPWQLHFTTPTKLVIEHSVVIFRMPLRLCFSPVMGKFIPKSFTKWTYLVSRINVVIYFE